MGMGMRMEGRGGDENGWRIIQLQVETVNDEASSRGAPSCCAFGRPPPLLPGAVTSFICPSPPGPPCGRLALTYAEEELGVEGVAPQSTDRAVVP